MYAIIYKPAEGENPAEIKQVVNNTIDSKNWTDGSGLSYTNCADRAALETELANLDASWETKVDVRYYMK